MKAVFSALQKLHAPKRVIRYGRLVDYPEKPSRADALLKGVKDASVTLHAARRFEPLEHYKGVHSLRYIRFLQNVRAEWDREMGALSPIAPGPRPVVRPASYPKAIAGRAGWHMPDTTAPIEAATWKAAKASADTALTAAHMALKGERAVYALCRPPGHHAGFETAAGFCYINNTALAAQALRREFSRVAVLDIDVHHGNGTQGIFYDRSDVYTISIHADPKVTYPFYSGYEHEIGQGRGYGFNLNIPLDEGSDDEIWAGAVEYACKRLEAYRPGALVVALGLDMMAGDGLMHSASVTQSGLERMARRMRALDVPSVIVQEGGYSPDNLRKGIAAFLGPWL
jgi:acetoin utilization deacetylase AcuC-like enzyme